MAAAVRGLSPVRITDPTPMRLQLLHRLHRVRAWLVAHGDDPKGVARGNTTAVLPSSSKMRCLPQAKAVQPTMRPSRNAERQPMLCASPTWRLDALAHQIALASRDGSAVTPASLALFRMAMASGWLDPFSTPAATASSSASVVARQTAPHPSPPGGHGSASRSCRRSRRHLRRRLDHGTALHQEPAPRPGGHGRGDGGGTEMTSAQGQPISSRARPR
jgi:hypothetical protein